MRFRHPRRANGLVVCFVLPLAFACAANTVKPIAEARSASPQAPTRVLVYDPLFHDSGGAQSSNTVGAVVKTRDDHYPRGDLGKEAAHMFAVEMVKSISKLGLHAERAGRHTPVPPNALIVVGELVNVKKGNNVARLVVGFGAGKARLDMRVFVYDMGERHNKVLELTSHADSGHLPGTAVTLGAGAAATGGLSVVAGAGALVGASIKTYRYQLEQLAKRSANHATVHMSRYFARQGWIAQDRVKKTKPISRVLDVY